ncbi:DNA double-strand break repair nuclease NurA [Vulcanisaeta thermophila]|uniref:DNA double-strand break repair nuclease NurA n=1 Tax=Vulcanisaeta thermophila TaxID=867917 RepID=UPI0008538206|nr:DNA double-strand break repair nuclease NurA [Vulcanisaeta thermophila]
MREIFELASSLGNLMNMIGELASPELIDLSESGGFEVVCDTSFEIKKLDVGGDLDHRLMGLDSHSRVVKFLGVDVHVVTGALVGDSNVLIPKPNVGDRVKWVGLKLRFKPRSYELLDKLDEYFYVKSSFLEGEYFVGSYNDEAVRDEVRNNVEVALIKAADRSAFLLIDGPIFPTPRVLMMEGNRYALVYEGIIRSRVEALRGLRAVGVVKRIEHSHILAKYLTNCSKDNGPMVDDYTLAIKRASLALPNAPKSLKGLESCRTHMLGRIRRIN